MRHKLKINKIVEQDNTFITINVDLPITLSFQVKNKHAKNSVKSGEIFSVNVDLICVKIYNSYMFLDLSFLETNYKHVYDSGVLHNKVDKVKPGSHYIENNEKIREIIKQSNNFLKNIQFNDSYNTAKVLIFKGNKFKLPSNIMIRIKDPNGRKHKVYTLINGTRN